MAKTKEIAIPDELNIRRDMMDNLRNLVDYLTTAPIVPHTKKECAEYFDVCVDTIESWVKKARNLLGFPIIPSQKGMWLPNKFATIEEFDLYMQTQTWCAKAITGAVTMKQIVDTHKNKSIPRGRRA